MRTYAIKTLNIECKYKSKKKLYEQESHNLNYSVQKSN